MEDVELGTLLKKARQEKDLTVADIQERTKIRKKYLEAIENNNFELLPGKVYLKVFVKGYAREVGINYQKLLHEYSVLNIKERNESNLQKDYLEGNKVPHKPQKKNKKNIFKTIIIIFLIIFLGAAAVYTYQYISDSNIRLLGEKSKQEEKVESEPIISEVNEEDAADQIEEKTNDQAVEIEAKKQQLETETNFNLFNNNKKDNTDFLDSFNSQLLNKENIEIIDQNNFNELKGLDPEEQNQITEIIVSETDNIPQNVDDSSQESLIDNQAKTNNNFENDSSMVSESEKPELFESESELESEKENISNFEETIVFTATEKVWITIDLDGKKVFSGILEAGDQRKFNLTKNMYLKIGKGEALIAEVSGEQYGPWDGVSELEFLKKEDKIIVNNIRE